MNGRETFYRAQYEDSESEEKEDPDRVEDQEYALAPRRIFGVDVKPRVCRSRHLQDQHGRLTEHQIGGASPERDVKPIRPPDSPNVLRDDIKPAMNQLTIMDTDSDFDSEPATEEDVLIIKPAPAAQMIKPASISIVLSDEDEPDTEVDVPQPKPKLLVPQLEAAEVIKNDTHTHMASSNSGPEPDTEEDIPISRFSSIDKGKGKAFVAPQRQSAFPSSKSTLLGPRESVSAMIIVSIVPLYNENDD